MAPLDARRVAASVINCAIAVAIWVTAKGFWTGTLFGMPSADHWYAPSPVMYTTGTSGSTPIRARSVPAGDAPAEIRIGDETAEIVILTMECKNHVLAATGLHGREATIFHSVVDEAKDQRLVVTISSNNRRSFPWSMDRMRQRLPALPHPGREAIRDRIIRNPPQARGSQC